MSKWTKNSWENFTVKHIPEYKDKDALKKALKKIEKFPPLVFAGECNSLKQKLASAVEGKAFLIQGGECAESFKELNANNIRDTFRVILQMSAIFTAKMKVPIIKVGRIAGQFAKPRSSDFETVNDKTLPSYFGDSINSIEFSFWSLNKLLIGIFIILIIIVLAYLLRFYRFKLGTDLPQLPSK